MGWKIGAPSLKLNNAGTVSKHCGDFGSVAREALQEREGHDPDIDQSRAELNRYQGFQTAAELQAFSAQHVDELRDAAGRKLRKDAVVMCATILKPPAAYMNSLPMSDQRRFLDDANEAFAEIIGQGNIKSRADHFDELGAHSHVFWEPMTEDGRLCAKEMHNLQFFGRVNRELPEKLRAKGWAIEDCEMYDAAKEQYERQKNENAGRSSVAFKAEAEKQKAEILEDIKDLQEERKELSQEVTEQRQEARKARARVKGIQDDLDALQRVTTSSWELQEQYQPLRRTFTGKEVFRKEDIDHIRDSAITSHIARSEARSSRSFIEKLQEELSDINEELKLERQKRAIEERRNRQLQGIIGLMKRFLAFFGLYDKYTAWEKKQLAEIERRENELIERSIERAQEAREERELRH